jgi:hypothetical protein
MCLLCERKKQAGYIRVPKGDMLGYCAVSVLLRVTFHQLWWKKKEPGKLRRYSDWLQAGRPRGQSSSPGRGKNFIFSKSSRPVLVPTQPPIQWVRGALSSGVKRPGREAGSGVRPASYPMGNGSTFLGGKAAGA